MQERRPAGGRRDPYASGGFGTAYASRMRMAGSVDRARSEAVLEQLGDGCTSAQLVRMGKDERKKHQKWKERVEHNSRWMAGIVISSFKRLLGEVLRAMKPEYIMMEWPPRWPCITNPRRHARGHRVRWRA